MKLKLDTVLIIFILTIITALPAFADLSMAGADLPFSGNWYKNPALENIVEPRQVFTSPLSIPLGLMKLFNPATFPYELFDGELSEDLDIDLLTMYVQLSNPSLLIINPPVSPENVYLSISGQSINFRDDEGSQIPFESIPGRDSMSISGTPLLPPPIFSLRKGWDNIFIGLGFFEGTSGISFNLDENFEALLALMEVKAGDSASLEIVFTSRTGFFEYINIITDPIILSDSLEISLASRLLFYQNIAEVNASASLDVEIMEDYLLSELNTDLGLFYYYPGTGFGAGARLDIGSVLRFSGWTFGISVLNAAGLEYSSGLSLQDGVLVKKTNFYTPFRPLVYMHTSYLLLTDNGLTVIPVIDIGYGKNFFAHTAVALFWKSLSFKAGIAYEQRMKAAVGAGIRLGSLSIESGIAVQESVFNNLLAGLFISIGFGS